MRRINTSVETGGSFFTHALVSGLLGAADRDDDGAVSLSEAYQHAYDATLRASSRTLFGTHPMFCYTLGLEVQGEPHFLRPSEQSVEFSLRVGMFLHPLSR